VYHPTVFPLDVTAMRRQLGDDDELISEVIALFLSDYRVRLQTLKAAFDARDAGGLRTAAHTLKGSASTFCASRVVSTAAELETASQVEDFAVISGYVDDLTAEVEQLADALRMCQGENLT
jgi:HPt (histidine-containing phosphotransfer) domain-containing protein